MNETHICENCGQEHDGSYGSGRFCSSKCAHVYVNHNPITLEKLNSGQCSQVTSHKLSKWLLRNKIKENRCEECGISEWNGKPLTIQLHHIDGNEHNNALENLQMLCPNCHSQTPNFMNKKR